MARLAQKVLQSLFFKKAQQKAFSYLQNPARLLHLLQQVGRQINNTADKESNPGIMDNLRTLVRMVNAYRLGTYRLVPWQTIGKIVAILVYFVLPLDFIPDVLPVLGFTDDFALIFWALRSFSADIDAFRAWEVQTGATPAAPAGMPETNSAG
jgi:uncharacterized membrane protein YkvA (DUF1232 family)